MSHSCNFRFQSMNESNVCSQFLCYTGGELFPLHLGNYVLLFEKKLKMSILLLSCKVS